MKYEIANPNKQRSMFDLFFGDKFYDDFFIPANNWAPAVDIVDKGEKYLIKADLPGVDEKDISLEVQDGVLTIKGERKNEHEEEFDNVYRSERSYGSFLRSFNLSDIKEENIKAEYKNGILTVELPKAEEKKAKRIEIKH
ncbi:MAG: Hsp20/alpha crystallin family protein [bacterium]